MSVTKKCGKRSKSTQVKYFHEFPDPKKEAQNYLTCWCICTKREEKVDLTKNERSVLADVGEVCCGCAAVGAKKYIESRRRANDVGGDATDAADNTESASLVRPHNLLDSDATTTEDGDPSGLIITDEITKEQRLLPAIDYTQFNLEIPDLDEAGFSTVLFGSSKSGKTTLMKKILKIPELADPDVIKFLISPSMHAKIYKDLDKKIIKLSAWDDRLVKGIQKVQKKTKNRYKYLLIIDDCILDKNSGKIMELFCTLRNIKISTLMLLQSTTLLNRNSRFNANNIIFKKMNVDDATEQNMQWFLGSYAPFKGLNMDSKKELYREITNDYGFINLDALNGTLQCCKD